MESQRIASSSSAPVLLLTVSRPRSASPVSPTPDLRGVRLFRAIGRRLGQYRRRQERRREDDDDSSSSTDSDSRSCSSSGEKGGNHSSAASSDDSGVGLSPRSANDGSSPRTSFRKVFQTLNIHGRSHSASCASTPAAAAAVSSNTSSSSGGGGKRKKSPKRILRAPVSYTYVRGLSGLPTQRVPRDYQCAMMPQPACCAGAGIRLPASRHVNGPGLNR